MPEQNLSDFQMLVQFHKDVMLWIAGGCEYNGEYTTFLRDHGLCSNLTRWATSKMLSTGEHERLSKLLSAEFKASGLDGRYPFESEPPLDSSEGAHIKARVEAAQRYRSCVIEESMYKNPKRLAWVHRYAALAS